MERVISEDTYSKVADSVRRFARNIDYSQIRSNPISAVAVTAGGLFILSRIMRSWTMPLLLGAGLGIILRLRDRDRADRDVVVGSPRRTVPMT